MAAGSAVKYNGLEKTLTSTDNRDWDDAAAGNIMFVLAGAGYTPIATHSTTADLTNVITAGDGAPISATGLTIDNTTTPGTTCYKSDDVNFGSAVTIEAKYLIAIQPVTPGTYSATTGKLLFYLNLNTSSGSATAISTASDFVVYTPANGWIKTV